MDGPVPSSNGENLAGAVDPERAGLVLLVELPMTEVIDLPVGDHVLGDEGLALAAQIPAREVKNLGLGRAKSNVPEPHLFVPRHNWESFRAQLAQLAACDGRCIGCEKPCLLLRCHQKRTIDSERAVDERMA